MALLFADGFDQYAITDRISRGWSTNSTSSMTGRFGGNAMASNSGSVSFANNATIICGAAIYFNTAMSAQILLAFYDTGGTQVDVRSTVAGAIQVTRNGTQLAISSNGIISYQTWFYLEFKVIINNSTGTYDVWLNGTNIITGTGADTQTTVNAYANQVNLSSSTSIFYDDFYIDDATVHSPIKITSKLSDANGTNQDFTPSTGVDHFAVIDDATPSGTDYLYSDTVNHVDTNGFAAITLTGTPIAVQICSYLKKDDASARHVSPVIRSGVTNYVGADDYNLNDSYKYFASIYTQDPNTSATWTQAGINNAEYGAKVIS